MNFKEILQQIETKQQETFCLLADFIASTTLLPRKRRGLYWIWSRLDFEIIAKVITDNKTRQVPFDKLIKQRMELNHICRVAKDEYVVVYNGKGGYKSDRKSFGLRERILQEITCNDHRTGTLNISKWFNPEDWAVSFFDFDAPENQTIVKMLQSENCYSDFAADLEMLWRLEYGHPILCRH